MRLSSVMAAVLDRYNDSQRLSLHSREGGISYHQGLVKAHAVFHHERVETHNVDDVPNATSSFDGGVKLTF